MRIATWNVTSIKMRAGHVLNWLTATQTDVLCLQELKVETRLFPYEAFQEAGYEAHVFGQKTYNGVAVLLRKETTREAQPFTQNIPGFDDPQSRLLGVSFSTAAGPMRVLSAYFPNGAEVASEKFTYKLAWINALSAYLKPLVKEALPLFLCGDFNIAPEDLDCWNPALWEGNILVSPEERAAFRDLLALGLKDSFRLFEAETKAYTWWDYRMLGFQKNHGMRINHILVNDAAAKLLAGATIDRAPRKLEKPSDHTPYVIELSIS